MTLEQLYKTYWLFVSGPLEGAEARERNLFFRRWIATHLEGLLERGSAGA